MPHLSEFKPGDIISEEGTPDYGWEVLPTGQHKYVIGTAYPLGYTTGFQPNGVLTILLDGHNWELRRDDFDDFTEWVKCEQAKAKEPKNAEFRRFLDRRAKISRMGAHFQRGRVHRLGKRR